MSKTPESHHDGSQEHSIGGQHMVLFEDGTLKTVSADEAEELREAAAKAKLEALRAQVEPEGLQSLHPDTFPQERFPSLFKPREPRELTAEDLEREEKHFAESQIEATQRKNAREQQTRVGTATLNWADTALFDLPSSSMDEKSQKELTDAQEAYVRLMLQMRDLTDNAPSNPAGIARFLDKLSDLVDAELVARGWQSHPLHGKE